MSVSQILQNKGRDVATIDPSRTLSEAIHTLAQWKIGALLVTDGSKPVTGIISERDIVRVLALHGASALDEPISRHMTTNVATCTGASDINSIMHQMTHGKFRHVPVIEAGELVGVISIGDVVKHRLAEIEAETQAIKDYIATA